MPEVTDPELLAALNGTAAPAGPIYGAPDPNMQFKVQDQALQFRGDARASNADARAAEAAARAAEADRRSQLEWNATHNPDGTPKTKGGKALADGTAKRVESGVGQYSALAGSLGGFKDDYAGNTLTGDLENKLQGINSSFGTEGQRNWWANFRATDNVIRNELFGAALTPQEKASYESTTIDPSLDPKIVRENLTKRSTILKGALERQRRFMLANGYNQEAVDILYEPLRALEQLEAQPTPGEEEEGLTGSVTDDSPAPPTVPGTSPGGGDLTRDRLADSEGGLVDLAKQGLTFGLADEAAGIGGGISGLFTGEGFTGGYERERDLARSRVTNARKKYGGAGTAVEFLGGGGAARIAAPAVNALGAIVKQGAGLGALGGFGYGEGAEGSAANALIGGAGGAALGGALYGAGRGVSALASRTKGAPVTAEQLGVIQAGEREGVRVMTSDVRPPRTFTGKMARTVGERIPLAGTAGPRAAQQEERVSAVKNLLDEYGATNASDAVDAVSKDLVATRGAEIGRLKTQKDSVISGLQGPVSAPNAIAAIDQQISKLNGVNPEAFAPVVQRLQSFKDVLSSGKTLEQVEGNRKLLGDLFQDPNLASIKGDGQKALNAIYDPLRTDMGNFIKQNGGPGAFAKWRNANDKLAAMAGELDATAFKSLLNKADTTPEAAAKIMFGKTPSDMKKLYGSLSQVGKDKAQAAILHRAAEGAVEGDSISPQKFANAMQALDKATGVFFAPADKARIDGLTKLLKATQQASVASAAPPTGVQNTQLAGGYTLGTLFGTAALPATAAVGLLARAYETAPVRNALLRLGRAPANSQAAGKAMNGVYAALSKFAANDNAAGALAASPGNLAAQENGDRRREPPQ